MQTEASVHANPHYNRTYFAEQRNSGEYSAIIDIFKFSSEIRPTDRLIDFGCGGGYMLARLEAKEKIGVEINDSAASVARAKGLKIVSALEDIVDGWADVVISHHALEHVDDPLGAVRAMKTKLRSGGKLVIVTPVESYRRRFREEDINFHLFTWSPSNLGNLLKRAGFVRIDAAALHHRWPPYWYVLRNVLPQRWMHLLCTIHGRLRPGISQVKVVANKP